MRYAQKPLLNKRLPSYTGLFVLLFALGIIITLTSNSLSFVSRATVGSAPKNIEVSNVSDTSFTVSYTTDVPALGSLAYGTTQETANIALDDRDKQTSNPVEHQIHFITVNNLSPSTKYYYKITSGSQIVENNSTPFEITTAAALATQTTTQQPLSGTVALSDGTIPVEGVVYASATNAQQLAALINADGSYQIPLAKLRNSILSASLPITQDTILQLQAITPTQQSTVSILASQASHVPKIVLQQNYNFTLNSAQALSNSAQTASGPAFPVFDTPAPVKSPEITTPTSAQAFKDQQPTFQGMALPNTEVDILIQSAPEISVKLQSDNTGKWLFRPPVALASGNHTITIKSVDASGIVQTISRSFVVYASGSQFIEPSVSPVASVSAIPTLAPTIAATPTMAPTPVASATPTLAVTPIMTQPPTIVPTRTPLPKTGSSVLVDGMITAATAISIGALLFLFTIV